GIRDDLVTGVQTCALPIFANRQTNCDTSYLALVGPGTAWPGATPIKLNDLGDRAARTIMVLEVAGSKINWMEPRDLEISELKARSEERRVGKESRDR